MFYRDLEGCVSKAVQPCCGELRNPARSRPCAPSIQVGQTTKHFPLDSTHDGCKYCEYTCSMPFAHGTVLHVQPLYLTSAYHHDD